MDGDTRIYVSKNSLMQICWGLKLYDTTGHKKEGIEFCPTTDSALRDMAEFFFGLMPKLKVQAFTKAVMKEVNGKDRHSSGCGLCVSSDEEDEDDNSDDDSSGKNKDLEDENEEEEEHEEDNGEEGSGSN